MPTCLYLRGVPGTGKRTVADILERDLKWPVLWVHHFDAVYRAIGEYKLPGLTDKLMLATARYMASTARDFMVVRPTRDGTALWVFNGLSVDFPGYSIIKVRLTASYATLVHRVETRVGDPSPFRLTTKEALDEYLEARPESSFPGEHVIDTDRLSPEQVAGRIKELLA